MRVLGRRPSLWSVPHFVNSGGGHTWPSPEKRDPPTLSKRSTGGVSNAWVAAFWIALFATGRRAGSTIGCGVALVGHCCGGSGPTLAPSCYQHFCSTALSRRRWRHAAPWRFMPRSWLTMRTLQAGGAAAPISFALGLRQGGAGSAAVRAGPTRGINRDRPAGLAERAVARCGYLALGESFSPDGRRAASAA